MNEHPRYVDCVTWRLGHAETERERATLLPDAVGIIGHTPQSVVDEEGLTVGRIATTTTTNDAPLPVCHPPDPTNTIRNEPSQRVPGEYFIMARRLRRT